jgi:hypothetical protein
MPHPSCRRHLDSERKLPSKIFSVHCLLKGCLNPHLRLSLHKDILPNLTHQFPYHDGIFQVRQTRAYQRWLYARPAPNASSRSPCPATAHSALINLAHLLWLKAPLALPHKTLLRALPCPIYVFVCSNSNMTRSPESTCRPLSTPLPLILPRQGVSLRQHLVLGMPCPKSPKC